MSSVLWFLKTHDREAVFLAGAVFAVCLWYIATWITSLWDDHKRRERLKTGRKP